MVFRATLSNEVNFNPLESFPYLTLIHPRVQSLSKLPYDLAKHFSILDEFYFSWLENSAITMGKAASILLMLNHLK